MGTELYAKLDQNIVYSSMWEEDGDTVKVWITILALKNYRTGIVDKNITGIARLCNLSIEKVQAAITKFESPDPNSTTKAHEGRRLQKIDGGWKVLNHDRYLKFGWSDEKREYERQRKAQWRDGQETKTEPAKQVKPTKKPKEELVYTIPDNIDNDEFRVWWSKWLEHLGQKKKKPTQNAIEMQLGKLSKAGVVTAIAMLQQAIEKNWQGLYEVKTPPVAVQPNGEDRIAYLSNKSLKTPHLMTKEENQELMRYAMC
jgi:hypothetical protein